MAAHGITLPLLLGMLRTVIVCNKLFGTSKRDLDLVSIIITVGRILPVATLSDTVYCVYDIRLGDHLDRFQSLIFGPLIVTVSKIYWTGNFASDQLAKLLLDSLVLQAQLLALIANGSSICNILIVHANDRIETVRCRSTVSLFYELITLCLAVRGFDHRIQALVWGVISEREHDTLVVSPKFLTIWRTATRDCL